MMNALSSCDLSEELPFVSRSDGKINSLWSVHATGDWSADNRIGASYAESCMGFMREKRFPGFLVQVVKAMGGRPFTGVEIGFLTAIGSATMGLVLALCLQYGVLSSSIRTFDHLAGVVMEKIEHVLLLDEDDEQGSLEPRGFIGRA